MWRLQQDRKTETEIRFQQAPYDWQDLELSTEQRDFKARACICEFSASLRAKDSGRCPCSFTVYSLHVAHAAPAVPVADEPELIYAADQVAACAQFRVPFARLARDGAPREIFRSTTPGAEMLRQQ